MSSDSSQLSHKDMPTYGFRCPNGHEFDRFYRTISGAATELPCPECGAVAVRTISGGAGLVFKGSGFYLTDYGKNAHRKPAAGSGSKDSAAKTDGAAKPETKSDAKSESKSDGSKTEGSTPKSSSSKPGSE
ncbi:MAG TPA: FmdB family zinc ribbon protein [Gemmatimonadaceae bacterium]|nr:FmdB family zinc ribbon protein [Gemmatimonadaceae bacterium]